MFSGFLFRYTYPCLHNQPLQVRSYSVKFPLSPFRCCQAWYSYNVKSFLSLTLCFWVLAWYSYSVKFFFSCCQPTNIKYHLLQSESDWSRLLLSICWLGLRSFVPFVLASLCSVLLFSAPAGADRQSNFPHRANIYYYILILLGDRNYSAENHR